MKTKKLSELVSEVQQRIEEKDQAKRAVDRARSNLANAESELVNASTRLDVSRNRLFEEFPELGLGEPAPSSSGSPIVGGAFERIEVDDEDTFPVPRGIEFRARV